MPETNKTAVIVGAGPAGLTAALELLQRTGVRPIVFEADRQVGGISKTINYRGNRMDIGGHRFFSKSDWVMNWWQNLLPIAQAEAEASAAASVELAYQGKRTSVRPEGSNNADPDRVMLVRSRLSRIFYRRRFFDYPLKLNSATLGNLGALYTAQVGASYLRAQLAPRSPEATLEDFLVNRFGDKLYRTFFKDYTEKVWGVPCSEISAEWGAQRIKGLSITKAVMNALAKPFRAAGDTQQKNTETSLIERFLYPKFGPGQMWEEATARVVEAGGKVHLRHEVTGLHVTDGRVDAVDVRDLDSGEVRRQACDFLVSTMPVKRLVELLKPADAEVARVAGALPYRDFITAGLLMRRMPASSGVTSPNGMPPDNWIYVQEPDVKLGRLQIFNNWSPYLVADPSTIWLGLEYFCAEGDELWSMGDGAFLEFASRELEKIGLADRKDVLDGTVVRVPKAYPAYFGEYRGIGRVRAFLDRCPNLFPVGRNGMHRYNNQDHSMLAARAAVDCIAEGHSDKSRIWSVNAEEDYHEETSQPAEAAGPVAGQAI
jgi:protoporphyrinogen oxidase